MSVYLIKDSPTETMDDIVEWSEADLAKAKGVLESEGFVLAKDMTIIYERGKAAVGLGKKKITIDNPETMRRTMISLFKTIMPGYCVDDDCTFYLPMDWQEKTFSE